MLLKQHATATFGQLLRNLATSTKKFSTFKQFWATFKEISSILCLSLVFSPVKWLGVHRQKIVPMLKMIGYISSDVQSRVYLQIRMKFWIWREIHCPLAAAGRGPAAPLHPASNFRRSVKGELQLTRLIVCLKWGKYRPAEVTQIHKYICT